MAISSSFRALASLVVCVVANTASLNADAADAAGDESSGAARAKGSERDDAASESDGDSDSAEVPEQVATNVAEKKTYTGTALALGHKGQFHVRLGLGAGYRVMMRYDRSPTCSAALDDDGNPVKMCGYGAPLMLDTALGYGVASGFEPFVWGRFGLKGESNTHTAPLMIVGVGARFYSMSEEAFKFYVEPAVGLEVEGGANRAVESVAQYKQDLILRLGLGPQYDFSRNFGVFATGGLSVGMFRAIHTWLDLHLGVQARFP